MLAHAFNLYRAIPAVGNGNESLNSCPSASAAPDVDELESKETASSASDQQVTEAVFRAREGDEEASRWLIQHLYPLVIKIVRANRPRRMDEEDLAQMVFVRVFSKLDQWRQTARFEHWVSRVAVNVCLGQVSYHKVRPELRMADLSEAQAEWLEQVSTDEGDLRARDEVSDRDLAMKLLEGLAPRDRLVLQLMDVEGRSVEEISNVTGWSRTMVKVQAFRARARMRKLMAKLS